MNDDHSMSDDDVYGSGLNSDDWISLRDVIWSFLHAKDLESVEIPPVPQHLQSHPLIEFIQKYKSTGDEEFLDKAGQILIPSEKPFGWYLGLTK